MIGRVFALVLLAVAPCLAVPGAWERFGTQEHADAWSFFDFSTEMIGDVFWEDVEDPFISAITAADSGVWWFVDSFGGQDKLLGDFRDVRRIQGEFFVDDPDDVDFIDMVIAVDIGGEVTFCFSPTIDGDELNPLGGWEELSIGLGQEWFTLDSNDEFQPITLTPAMLSDVQELGFRVFPAAGAEDQFFGLDNIKLVARLSEPEISSGISAGNFTLGFTPAEGVQYELQEFNNGWSTVSGSGEITGPQVFSFSEPVGDFGMFRVRYSTFFTEIPAPN